MNGQYAIFPLLLLPGRGLQSCVPRRQAGLPGLVYACTCSSGRWHHSFLRIESIPYSSLCLHVWLTVVCQRINKIELDELVLKKKYIYSHLRILCLYIVLQQLNTDGSLSKHPDMWYNKLYINYIYTILYIPYNIYFIL